jgi:leucyl/phenylalanyl-tRNA--protein transferase
MQKLMKQNLYTVTFNKAFETVIKNCRKVFRKDQDGTWITSDMEKAYTELHKKGYAASVEVWEKDKLVGGLYGVTLNNAFFGESMFHHKPNTSKLALIFLAQNFNYKIIDCQVHTSHLESLGAEYIPLEEFLTSTCSPSCKYISGFIIQLKVE